VTTLPMFARRNCRIRSFAPGLAMVARLLLDALWGKNLDY
jgi:hypothetical protein